MSRESLLSTENTAPRTRMSSFLNPRLLNKLFLSLFHSFLQFHCPTLCIGSQQPKPLPWGAGVSSGRGAKEHWWGIGFLRFNSLLCSLMVQQVKNLPAKQETQEMWVQSLGQENLLEKGKATHSSILAWRIPGTEEPGGLPSMGLQRVGHDWSDSTQGPAPCGVTSPGGRGGQFP